MSSVKIIAMIDSFYRIESNNNCCKSDTRIMVLYMYSGVLNNYTFWTFYFDMHQNMVIFSPLSLFMLVVLLGNKMNKWWINDTPRFMFYVYV